MHKKSAYRSPNSYRHSVKTQKTILDELGARETYERGPHLLSFHDVDVTCETDVFDHIEVGLTVFSPEYPLQRQVQFRAYGSANTPIVVMEVAAEWHSEIHYHAAIVLKTAHEEIHLNVGPNGSGRVRVSDLHGNGRAISQIESDSVRRLVGELSDPDRKEQVWQRICEELRGEDGV